VTIGSDAPALITKLEALSSAPLTNQMPTAPDELAARVKSLASALIANLQVRFDATSVPLALTDVTVDDRGDARVRLTGVVPVGARGVSWSTSLIFGAYPLAVRGVDDHEVVRWLQGREVSEPVALEGAPGARAFGQGVWLGFTHILPHGLDHILFVVGLFLLSTSPRQLLAQVSAFTLAHSLTLGLSLYGVVSLPGRVVEPLIALSVAYVGVENLFTSRLQPWRVLVVFGFGLLHGLGFAEALAALNLNRADLLSTLISFNVGVELGQLAVVAGASVAFFAVRHARREWHRPAMRVASGGVGLMGVVWMVERLF
jgi:hydrogenase/urease accessory protein HupE